MRFSHIGEKLIISLLFGLSIFVCFYRLDEKPLSRWDEYTNYRVIVDTIEAKSFPVLKYNNIAEPAEALNHEINPNLPAQNFFEKPPFWYWLNIAIVENFGMSHFNLRAVSAISGIGFLLMMFWVGRKISSFWGGVLAWVMALLTPHFFFTYLTYPFSTHTFRSADLDALQLFLIMLALNFFINLADKRQHQNLNIILASTFSALAYLTKGPFALIPGILFFIFYLIQLFKKQNSDQFNLKMLSHQFIIYVGIMLLIAGSWHIWMITKFGGEFINEYFVYHNVGRFSQPLEGHGGDVFTYIQYLFDKRLFLFAEVWILAVIFLIKNFRAKLVNNFHYYFSIIGSLLILLILTFTQTKLTWYLFYIYPFTVLVIVQSLNKLLYNRAN